MKIQRDSQKLRVARPPKDLITVSNYHWSQISHQLLSNMTSKHIGRNTHTKSQTEFTVANLTTATTKPFSFLSNIGGRDTVRLNLVSFLTLVLTKTKAPDLTAISITIFKFSKIIKLWSLYNLKCKVYFVPSNTFITILSRLKLILILQVIYLLLRPQTSFEYVGYVTNLIYKFIALTIVTLYNIGIQ